MLIHNLFPLFYEVEMCVFVRDYNKKRSSWITGTEIRNIHKKTESNLSLHEGAIHVMLLSNLLCF